MSIHSHNIETDTIVLRDLNEEEIQQQETILKFKKQKELEKQNKIQAKNALLNKLGITEEEAQLLLGGTL